MFHPGWVYLALAVGTARGDPELLQGSWKMVFNAQDGVTAAIDPANPMRCAVLGDKVSFTRDGKVVQEATFRLKPTAEPPEIDLVIAAKKQVIPGIYRLEGDTLTLCCAGPGKGRPIDFISKVESGHSLSVWKKDIR